MGIYNLKSLVSLLFQFGSIGKRGSAVSLKLSETSFCLVEKGVLFLLRLGAVFGLEGNRNCWGPHFDTCPF